LSTGAKTAPWRDDGRFVAVERQESTEVGRELRRWRSSFAPDRARDRECSQNKQFSSRIV
jgi:hypothetical protein